MWYAKVNTIVLKSVRIAPNHRHTAQSKEKSENLLKAAKQ